MKPGYRTSEFWFTLVSFIFSGLFLLGVIGDPSQKEELISNVSHAVESCILIGGQIVILYKYINGRNKVKLTHDKIVNDPIINMETENDQSRTNTGRSRKTNKSSKRKSNNSKKTSNK